MSNALYILLIGSLISNVVWLLIIYRLWTQNAKMRDDIESILDHNSKWQKFFNKF